MTLPAMRTRATRRGGHRARPGRADRGRGAPRALRRGGPSSRAPGAFRLAANGGGRALDTLDSLHRGYQAGHSIVAVHGSRRTCCSTRCCSTPARPAAPRPTCAGSCRRSPGRTPSCGSRGDEPLGRAALAADGWEVCRALACPARRASAGGASSPSRCCCPLARRAGRRRSSTRLASVAPSAPGVAARRHAPRRHVLPRADVRRGDDVRHAPGRRRAARHADALITGSPPRRATRSARELGLDPAASPSSTTAHEPRDIAAPAPEAEVRARYEPGRRRASCCASPPSARTRTRSCSSARCAAARPATCALVLAGHPEPYDAELRELAARARASRTASRSPAGCPTPTSRRCGRSPACAALPDARRGLRAAGARGAGARRARSRARTSRCCARSAATLPR